jgi:hypothetical protein
MGNELTGLGDCDVDDAPIEGWPTDRQGSNPSVRFPLGMPQLEPVPGTKFWVVTETFAYRDRRGKLHIVPNGFVTDGASIPALFWMSVGHPFDPDFICAALIHDEKWGRCKTWRDRTKANDLFREILEEQGKASCWGKFSLSTGVWFGKLGNALAFWR